MENENVQSLSSPLLRIEVVNFRIMTSVVPQDWRSNFNIEVAVGPRNFNIEDQPQY